MRKTIYRILSVIMVFCISAAFLPESYLCAEAEETAADSSDGSGQNSITAKITDQSTWHVLEERSLSELIHDDYGEMLRKPANKKSRVN